MSGTHIFKIGDKVRRIFGGCEGMKVGGTSVVVGINGIGLELEDFKGNHEYDYFELVEEEAPTFNLKTKPWFIRVSNKEESKLAQEWLFSQGVFWNLNPIDLVRVFVDNSGYLTNQRTDLVLGPHIMHGLELESKEMNCSEIKLNFKTTIESVEYPEVKTQQEVAIEELEATIELAKQQISKLKEGKK